MRIHVCSLLFTVGVLTVSAKSLAQTPDAQSITAPRASSPAINKARHNNTTEPRWKTLKHEQQQALAPLAPQWNTLSEEQKRKWLAVSKNYGMLSPQDQTKLHSRMNEWVALSPNQRSWARLNFAQTQELAKTLTPEEKQAKWQAYQSLSDQEKAMLANAKPKPKSAALATKPVDASKLAHIPNRKASAASAVPAQLRN